MTGLDVAATHADLCAWGILEDEGAPVVSRRFRGAIARAAARLQTEEGPSPKDGSHALERAIDVALEDYPLPPAAVVRREHRKFILVVELASLPESVRRSLQP